MNIFRAIAALVSLSACGANAAGLPVHSGASAKDSAFVQAAEAVRPHGQGWTKLCFNVPAGREGEKESASQPATVKEGVDACYTYAEVRDPPTQILTAIYGVLQIQPAGRSLLVAFLPLYGMPGDPGYIQLDDAERIQLGFIRHDGCDGSGCYAMAPMPPALLDWMKGAKAISANSAGIDVSGGKGSVSLPCCGFGAAFDAAPVAPGAQDEMQRKIQETMRRRFADFTRTDWKKLCFDVASAGIEGKGQSLQQATGNEIIETCLTYAELRYQPGDIPLGNLGVLQNQPAGRTFAVLLMPLGSQLPPPPGHIRLDGAKAAKLDQAKDYCNQFGCFGWVEIPQAILDRMKAAKEISYVGTDVLGRDFTVPLPCCEFAAFFDGAPLPTRAQDEGLRHIPEVIRRRLADTIR